MKFMLYHWNTLSMNDIKTTLEEAGHEVDCIHYVFEDFDHDIEFEKRLCILFKKKRYDAVISFDFFQIISRVCNEYKIPYISWVWDSPQVNLYSKEAANSCNYIFVFDREAYDDLIKLGITTLYYLPLAVNTERLDQIAISPTEGQTYRSDISFVGSLYERMNLYDKITCLPEQLKDELYKILEKQSYINGVDVLYEELTEELWNDFMNYVLLDFGPNYLTTTKNTLFNRAFATKVTNIERTRIVSKLAKLYDFKLYTNSDTTDMPEINNQGYVDYFKNMPKVFKASGININMTLRTIKTGIPLRIFDILGSGGFLITNYQEDLDLFFENGVDLVYYHTEDEMFELIKYYYEHEEERNIIAKNGYEKVKQYHSYKVRIDYILDKVFYHKGEFDYMGCPAVKNKLENCQDDKSILSLQQSIWELLFEDKIVEAFDLFTLFYRNHMDLSDEQKRDKLFYECILKICIKEIQDQGRPMFISMNDCNKEKILESVAIVSNLISLIQKDYEDNVAIEELCNMLLVGEITCAQLIEIILVEVKEPIIIFNVLAEHMFKVESYNMIIPFLIEAEELDCNNKKTIGNLVQILSYLGEDELVSEYRAKL